MERNINENEQLYEILRNCLLALNCPRSRHYPNKNYGSHIKTQGNTISLKTALDYARQAVSGFDGVLIKSAELCDEGILFHVLVNNEKGEVTVKLE